VSWDEYFEKPVMNVIIKHNIIQVPQFFPYKIITPKYHPDSIIVLKNFSIITQQNLR